MGPKSSVKTKNLDNSNNPTEYFCFLSGLHTRPLELAFESFHFIGVQLEPAAIKALFRMPAEEVTDFYIPGEYLFRNLNFIEDTLQSLSNFHQRACWLEEFFFGYINESNELNTAIKLSGLMKDSTSFVSAKPRAKPENIMGYSRTHTHRIFKDWFGLSCGNMIKLLQFVNSLNRVHFSEDKLTTLGYESGYYDQAHFNRIFKEFSGLTPGQYRKLKSAIPGQLNC